MMKRISTALIALSIGLVPLGLHASPERDATLADMQAIADAMDTCFIFSGYYTTIENLDDTTNSGSTLEFQYIDDNGGALIIFPNKAIFEPNRVIASPTWEGPFLAINQSRLDPESDYDEGTIIDFFGNPYRFYTALGYVDPVLEDVTLEDYGDQFDRFAIVSYGPNGVYDDGGDDIVYEFGGAPTITTISSALFTTSVLRGGPAATMQVRGYNLGASQGSGQVLFDGAPTGSATVTNWSANTVDVDLATIPPDGTLVSVMTNSGTTSRQVVLRNSNNPTEVQNWLLY